MAETIEDILDGPQPAYVPAVDPANAMPTTPGADNSQSYSDWVNRNLYPSVAPRKQTIDDILGPAPAPAVVPSPDWPRPGQSAASFMLEKALTTSDDPIVAQQASHDRALHDAQLDALGISRIENPDVMLGRSLRKAGRYTAAAVEDAATVARPSEFGQNLGAVSVDPEIKTPFEINTDNSGAFQRLMGRSVTAIGESLPYIAASVGLERLGVNPNLAAGAPMAFTPDGLNIKQGIIMAGMPIVGRAGTGAAADAISALRGKAVYAAVQNAAGQMEPVVLQAFRDIPGLDNEVIRKAVEQVVGGGGASAAYLTAASMPEIMNLPESERKDAIINTAVTGLAFSALSIPGVLDPNVPSEYRNKIKRDVTMQVWRRRGTMAGELPEVTGTEPAPTSPTGPTVEPIVPTPEQPQAPTEPTGKESLQVQPEPIQPETPTVKDSLSVPPVKETLTTEPPAAPNNQTVIPNEHPSLPSVPGFSTRGPQPYQPSARPITATVPKPTIEDILGPEPKSNVGPETETVPPPTDEPNTDLPTITNATPIEHINARYPIAGPVSDGRAVRTTVPNTGSISASLNDYDVLKGIRDVPMSEFTLTGTHYSAEGTRHIADLAERIGISGSINPLIVAVDKDGPYILEGANRAEALFKLGAKSFPAIVVIDNEGAPKPKEQNATTEEQQSGSVRSEPENRVEGWKTEGPITGDSLLRPEQGETGAVPPPKPPSVRSLRPKKGTNENQTPTAGTGGRLPGVERPPRVDEGKPATTGGTDVQSGDATGVSGPSSQPGASIPGENGTAGSPTGAGAGNSVQPDSGANGRPSNDAGPAAGPDQPGTGETAPPVDTHDQSAPTGENHRIGPDDKVGVGGDIFKARANIAAIKLLKTLESENRPATPEEKRVLAQYVGWGGIKPIFDIARMDNRKHVNASWFPDDDKVPQANWEKQWGKLADEVKSMLTQKEWNAAAQSILNAHYTSREVIQHGLWDLALHLGFKGGHVVETSAGIGSILGLTPESVAKKTKWTAVELDDISSRMLKKLYPQARVFGMGFESAPIKDNSVAMVIGNFPFAKEGPSDKRYPNLSLHNYFFVRSVDTLAPGGLIVAITSNSTMDNGASLKARELLANKADLVGAIRLPNNAFKKNAGTEVTTDILVFRKKEEVPFQASQAFRDPVTIQTYDGKPVMVNEYFANHPEMMLGRMSLEGTMYGGNEPALLPNEGQDLVEALKSAVAKFPTDVMGRTKGQENFIQGQQSGAGMENGSFVISPEDKQVYFVEAGQLVKPEWATGPGGAKLIAQAKSYIGVRDVTNNLITAQFDPDSLDVNIEALRKQLNKLYDTYASKHGPFNGARSSYLDDDSRGYSLVTALENLRLTSEDRPIKTGKNAGKIRTVTVKNYDKSDIFDKRTIFPRVAPTSADTIEDAIHISLAYRNALNAEYIGQLLGKPADEVHRNLVDSWLAFENPTTGLLETPDEYLSGFVRKKLGEAKEKAAEDPAYKSNVEALEKVQPATIAPDQIGIRLGAAWIPPSVVRMFLSDVMEVGAEVTFSPEINKWFVRVQSGHWAPKNTATYGAGGFGGHEIVEDTLNLKTPVAYDTVKDENGNPKRVKNQERTIAAVQKQEEIKTTFQEYVRGKTEVMDALATIYNDRYNGVVLRKYSAPIFEGGRYPNASTAIMLNDHQKEAVTRILAGSMGLFHGVGLGKTYTMVTAAMEMRRLGLAKKPMIVVQNSTLNQFAGQFKKLYPSAKLLVPSKKDRETQGRKRLLNRIATGDYDAVIIPSSFLGLIPDSPDRVTGYVQTRIDELTAARLAAGRENDRSPKAADMQKAIKALEKRLTELAKRKVDETLTFEKLGVDALFADEFHQWKKLEFTSQMDNVKGIDKSFSERGFSMFMKMRFIQERNNGKNTVGATGTPVSNTMAEAWNMIRYLRPDILKEYGMENFDSFASTFGDIISQFELTPTGSWKEVKRFAKFTNGPELIRAFHTMGDVRFSNQVNIKGIPGLVNGRPTVVEIEQTPEVTKFVQYLRDRLQAFADMSPADRRANSAEPLVVYGLARKATLDMRMIDPSLPKEDGSKIDHLVRNVFERYEGSNDILGTQLIFADLYQSPDEDQFLDPEETTPNPAYGKPRFNLYEAIRDELIEKGVPKNEIAIILDYKTDAQKESLFTRVSEGKIRVMIGSTDKMGVGVNVQERLVALHHMDAPARPMDVEQRNGRILRQGNTNALIELFVYGVKNTLDAARFQVLATKQKFINQILNGQLEGRNFEDAANEISLSYEEQMAAFSGDPLALEKVTLDSRIRQMVSLRASHAKAISDGKTRLLMERHTLPRLQESLAKSIETSKDYTTRFEGDNRTVEVNGKTYTDKKAGNEAIEEFFLSGITDAESKISKEHRTNDFELPMQPFKVNGLEFKATAVVPIDFTTGKQNPSKEAVVAWNHGPLDGRNRSGTGFAMSLKSQVAKVIEKHKSIQTDIERTQKAIAELEGFVKQPFLQEQELQEAYKRLESVVSALKTHADATEAESRKRANPETPPTEPILSLSGGSDRPRIILPPDVARGKPAIAAAIERSALAAETKSMAAKLLDMLPEEYLADLTVGMLPTMRPGSGGSYSDLLNVVAILNDSEASPETAAHEISHSLAKFLPANLRNTNIHQWLDAVEAEIKRSKNDPAKLDYLEKIIRSRGLTSLESNDWFNTNPGARSLYYLSNPDEFFAHNMTDAAFRAGPSGSWIMRFLKAIIAAIKRLFGSRTQFFDDVLAKFRSGEIRPDVDNGVLFERNKTKPMETLVTEPRKAERALSAAEDRGPVAKEIEARMISGQNEFVKSMIEKHMTGDESKAAQDKLGLMDVSGVMDKVSGVIPPETYQEGKSAVAGSGMAKSYSLEAAMRLAVFEKRLRDVSKEHDKAVEKFQSEPFQHKVTKVDINEVKAEQLNRAARSFDTMVASSLAKVTDLIASKGQNLKDIDRLKAERDALKTESGFTEAVKSAVKDMVNILGQQKDAVSKLSASNTTAQDIIDTYKALKERAIAESDSPPMQAPQTIEWAANILARDHELAQEMYSVAGLHDKLAHKSMTEFEKQMEQAFADSPRKAIRKLFSSSAAINKKAQRAKTTFLALHKDLARQLKDFAVLDQAGEVAKSALADPAFRAYQNEVYKDGGIEYRPEAFAGLFYDRLTGSPTVPLPDGSAMQVTLYGDANRFAKEWDKLSDVVQKWQIWKSAQDELPEAERDPMYEFGSNWLTILENLYRSSRVYDVPKLRSIPGSVPGGGAWNMTQYLWSDLGNRVAEVGRQAEQNFSRVAHLARMLGERKQADISMATLLATESHGFTKGGNSAGIIHWYNQVGRELYDSWQRPEGGYEEGVRTMTGHVITKADMDAVKEDSAASKEGFEILQSTGLKGRQGSMFPSRIEGDAEGAKFVRKSTEVSKYTKVRDFNIDALNFVKAYTEADQAGKLRLIDAYFGSYVTSFLKDRSFTVSQKLASPYEAAYRAIARDIQEHGIAESDMTFDWLVQQVAAVEEGEFEDIAKQVQADLEGPINTIAAVIEKDDKGLFKVETLKKSNSLTEERKDKIAPYWFYDTGFKTANDFGNFVHHIASTHLSVLLGTLQSVKADLERQRVEMATAMQRSVGTGKSPKTAFKAIIKNRESLVRQGKTLDDWLKLSKRIRMVDKFIQDLNITHGGVGNIPDFELGPVQRLLNQGVTGVLANQVVAIRNLFFGPIYLGALTKSIEGSVASSYAKAALHVLGLTAPKFLAHLGWSLGKVGLLGVRGAAQGAVSLVRGRGVRRSAMDAVGPMLIELSQNLYDRNALFRELQVAGIDSTRNERNAIEAAFAMPATAGKATAEMQSLFARTGGGILTMTELGLKAAFSATLKSSDANLNAGAMRLGLNLATNLEAHLREVYDTWKKTKYRDFNLSDPSDPVNQMDERELIPGWLGMARARGDLAHLKVFFNRGPGVPLQEAVIRFFKQLEGGNLKAKLFTPDEANRLAESLVKDVNQGRIENRPLMMAKGGLAKIAMQLNGWSINTARRLLDESHNPYSEKHRAYGWALNLFLGVLPFLLFAVATGSATEEVVRATNKVFNGEERATRQFWERTGTASHANGLLIAAFNPIPYIGGLVDMAINDMPTKGSFNGTVFAEQKVRDIVGYLGGVWNTGDPTYGLDRLVKSILPISSAVINRLPNESGVIDLSNARRLLQRSGPQDLLKKQDFSSSLTATPLSPYADRMVNDALRGDTAALQADYAAAVAKAKELGRPEPEKVVQQLFDSRNPYNQVFSHKLTPDQRAATLAAMSPGDRANVESAESAFAAGATAIGGNVTFEAAPQAASGGGGGGGGRVGGRGPGRVAGTGSILRRVSAGHRPALGRSVVGGRSLRVQSGHTWGKIPSSANRVAAKSSLGRSLRARKAVRSIA